VLIGQKLSPGEATRYLHEVDQLTTPLWPLLLYFLVVVLLLAIVLALSHFLGESHRERTTGEPYESGIMLTGSTGKSPDVRFYLMAVFFVIFDLEAAFIIGWAVAFRENGWSGYIEIVVFIGVLLATLVYLWRVGALDVAARGRQGAASRTAERLQ
jgi:NADH-quinone oxidoreductase subunit A